MVENDEFDIVVRFLDVKQDAAAEQKGMSGTTGQIQMKRRTHLSQPPVFVLKSSGW
jgi:hypothetical protein